MRNMKSRQSTIAARGRIARRTVQRHGLRHVGRATGPFFQLIVQCRGGGGDLSRMLDQYPRAQSDDVHAHAGTFKQALTHIDTHTHTHAEEYARADILGPDVLASPWLWHGLPRAAHTDCFCTQNNE